MPRRALVTGLERALLGVDRLFAARAAEAKAPSASYGVFDRSGLVHTGSTGLVDGLPPTPDTVYRIASCTKSFTATALLALRDSGLVSLDDPVTAYVPAFADVPLPTADSPVPTVRMLLTMSAGLPTDDPWGDRLESITDGDLDTLLGRGLRFDSVPGTRFAYSNLGYALLGRVVAVAAGRPYREVVEQTVLEPLGLGATRFTRPAVGTPVADGHRRFDDAWEPLPFSGPGAFSPIGGLFSTVTDLSRWARWLASAFDPERGSGDQDARGDASGILSPASRRELQQAYRVAPALATQPTGYGFGLFVEEQPGLGPLVSHSGGYPGFSAHMRWHPASGLGIVAFENATYAQVAVPAASTLHALLRDVGAGPVPAVWPEVLSARTLVEAALGGAELPADRVSENVELDVPIERRRGLWAEALAAAGVSLAGGAGSGGAGSGGAGSGGAGSGGAGSGGAGSGAGGSGGGSGAVSSRAANVPIDVASGEESAAPSHLVWRLAGERGRVRVEVRLTPESPPRIQTLNVRVEPA